MPTALHRPMNRIPNPSQGGGSGCLPRRPPRPSVGRGVECRSPAGQAQARSGSSLDSLNTWLTSRGIGSHPGLQGQRPSGCGQVYCSITLHPYSPAPAPEVPAGRGDDGRGSRFLIHSPHGTSSLSPSSLPPGQHFPAIPTGHPEVPVLTSSCA